MGINLLSYPYHDTTKTYRGITYTDNFNGSITLNGTTAGSISGFDLKYGSDALVLPQGTYIIRGTGSDTVKFRVRYYDVNDDLLGFFETTTTRTFIMDETDHSIRVDIRVPNRTTVDNVTVYPQIEAGTELSPWTPYRPPTTIDAENAKQIRQTMDVIIQVTPEQGDPIVINNDNLISCTVSLRSDLSIIEPTLPESEINIEAYFDDDISDTLASIPDETPVTYQAGYPGDMSPVRNFYLAEQITWRDNVMSIHAVDAVHKLDEAIPFDMIISTVDAPPYRTIAYLLDRQGVTFDYEELTRTITDQGDIIIKQSECRDIIASLMWLMSPNKITYDGVTTDVIFRYVDAGIPNLYWKAGESQWDIFEDDCGSVQRKTDRKIAKIICDWQNLEFSTGTNLVVGKFDWYKDTGAYLSIDEQVDSFEVALADGVGGYSSDTGHWPIIPSNLQGTRTEANNVSIYWGSIYTGASKLFGPDLPQAEMVGSQRSYYTQFIPWDCTYASGAGWGNYNSQLKMWNRIVTAGDISTDADSITFDLYGFKYVPIATKTELTGTGTGDTINLTLDKILGSAYAPSSAGYSFPDGVLQKRMENISNITGSFVWKGDPRMQPRDVVTFHRLDGTTEDITIENITITHEKGGTSAEITYRCGIC